MKHEAVGHPKMHDLAACLNLPLFAAHGILEMLWHHAGDYAPDGDIGKLKDSAIARAVDWRDDPDILIRALVESRWLDRHERYRLLVHDWPDHAQEWVKKKLTRVQKVKRIEDIRWLQVYDKPSVESGIRPATVQPPSSHRPATSTLTDKKLGNNDLSGQCRDGVASSPRAGGVSLAKFGKGSSSLGTLVLKPEKENERPPSHQNGHGWKSDKTIGPFMLAYTETGKPLTDSDWSEAWFEWRVLDFEQQLAAVDGIKARVEAGLCAEPEFVKLPKNYLKTREWTRAITKRKLSSNEELKAYWNS